MFYRHFRSPVGLLLSVCLSCAAWATDEATPQLHFEDSFLPGAANDVNQSLRERQTGPEAPASLRRFGSESASWIAAEGGLILETSAPSNPETALNAVLYERDMTVFGAFQADVLLDPDTVNAPGADVDTGFVIGAVDPTVNPNRFAGKSRGILFELKEFKQQGSLIYNIFADGESVAHLADPRSDWRGNPAYGAPNVLRWRPGPIHLRIVGAPLDGGTLLRFYLEDMLRPIDTYFLPRELTPNHIGFYARMGRGTRSVETRIEKVALRQIETEEALHQVDSADYVMENLDLSRPELSGVREAWENGDRAEAKRLFIEHLRNRKTPNAPEFTSDDLHPNYRAVADAALDGNYGSLGYFDKFNDRFIDEDGILRWDRGDGYLNRHYHWLALIKTYRETGDPRYAERFNWEVSDWLAKEPHIWYDNPNIGKITTRDGFTHRLGQLNGGNLGRRLEEVWWKAFDAMRADPVWTDASIFAFLDAALRNMKIASQPASFLVTDDSGAHLSVAMLQTALLFPEAKHADAWKEQAWERIDRFLGQQFHPDGSHVSLSSGYNWATLTALEHLIAVLEANHEPIPDNVADTLAMAYDYPMKLVRPHTFGNVNLNDGTWGSLKSNFEKGSALFPERQDIRFMATGGAEGTPPDFDSVYLPNAGYFVYRTGWGEEDRYLFFDAGPLGTTHGKHDKLNFYIDLGGKLLLGSAGRSDYSASWRNTYTAYGFGYNRILIDGKTAMLPADPGLGAAVERRRWHDDENYTYGEGTYRGSWQPHFDLPPPPVSGEWTRQITMVKGPNPPASAFWIVVDSLKTADGVEHQFEFPLHFATNQVEVDSASGVALGIDPYHDLRITPVDTDGLSLQTVAGREQPSPMGWRINGTGASPVPMPVYSWSSTGATVRAWIVEAKRKDDNWPVDAVRIAEVRNDGGISFSVTAGDLTHFVQRLPEATDPRTLSGESVSGDFIILTKDGAEVSSILEIGKKMDPRATESPFGEW